MLITLVVGYIINTMDSILSGTRILHPVLFVYVKLQDLTIPGGQSVLKWSEQQPKPCRESRAHQEHLIKLFKSNQLLKKLQLPEKLKPATVQYLKNNKSFFYFVS